MIIVASIIIASFLGDGIRFGMGLGDIFYLAGFTLSIPTTIIVYMILAKKGINSRVWILKTICLVLLLFILLKATLYRGPLSPWAGKVFFF